jgi:hypothetical protein
MQIVTPAHAVAGIPDMAPHFRHRALFIGPNARAAVNDGRAGRGRRLARDRELTLSRG